MSRTLTAADRSALIRLASTMPAGSEERKAILAGLSKKANAFPKGKIRLSDLAMKGLVQVATDIVKRTRPFEIDNPEREDGPKVTLTPKSTVTNTSFEDGIYTVYFGDSVIDGGDDYALTVDFQFRKDKIEWKMGNDY